MGLHAPAPASLGGGGFSGSRVGVGVASGVGAADEENDVDVFPPASFEASGAGSLHCTSIARGATSARARVRIAPQYSSGDELDRAHRLADERRHRAIDDGFGADHARGAVGTDDALVQMSVGSRGLEQVHVGQVRDAHGCLRSSIACILHA